MFNLCWYTHYFAPPFIFSNTFSAYIVFRYPHNLTQINQNRYNLSVYIPDCCLVLFLSMCNNTHLRWYKTHSIYSISCFNPPTVCSSILRSLLRHPQMGNQNHKILIQPDKLSEIRFHSAAHSDAFPKNLAVSFSAGVPPPIWWGFLLFFSGISKCIPCRYIP